VIRIRDSAWWVENKRKEMEKLVKKLDIDELKEKVQN